MANKKCPLCKRVYSDISSIAEHLETEHSEIVPKDWSGGKFYFYKNNGRYTGKCVICGKDTDFNETTCKPNRFCKNPKCKTIYREDFKKRMLRVYNKTTLLDDPMHQKKMLNNRSIAKDYIWSDGAVKRVIGSYEYDAARFMDIFMQLTSDDVDMPAPQVILYEYEGEQHMYIPDIYIGSLNLLVEIKDGGDNPNMHHKIQNVDKKKEKAKEEALKKYKFNYIKIENKQYGAFVNMVNELRNMETISGKSFTPLIITNEMVDILLEDTNCVEKLPYIVAFRFDDSSYDCAGILVGDTIYSYVDNDIRKFKLDNTVYIIKYYNILFSNYNFGIKLYDNINDYINTKIDKSYVNNVNFPLVLIFEIYQGMGGIDMCFNTNITLFDLYDLYKIEDLDKLNFLNDRTKGLIPMYNSRLVESTGINNIESMGERDDSLKQLITEYNELRRDLINVAKLHSKLMIQCLEQIDMSNSIKSLELIESIFRSIDDPSSTNIITRAINIVICKKQIISMCCGNNKEVEYIKPNVLELPIDEFLKYDKKYNYFAKRLKDSMQSGYIDFDIINERDEYINNLDESVTDSELYYLGINSI